MAGLVGHWAWAGPRRAAMVSYSVYYQALDFGKVARLGYTIYLLTTPTRRARGSSLTDFERQTARAGSQAIIGYSFYFEDRGVGLSIRDARCARCLDRQFLSLRDYLGNIRLGARRAL